MPLLAALFLLPWWGSAITIIGVYIAFLALVDFVFPLVAAEPFGSPADTRRAAIHFWLLAPISLLLLVALLVGTVRG